MITLKSGFEVSIAVGVRNYCHPRAEAADCPEGYESVELGFPSASDDLIMDWAEDKSKPTETVYGWVPAGIVKALIMKHGGVVSGNLPPLSSSVEQSFELAKALENIEIPESL